MTTPDNAAASLELNARGYRFDPILDAAADKLEQGREAWADMPAPLLRQATVHKDLRDHYRAAVKAGVVPDDRNATTYQEKTTW